MVIIGSIVTLLTVIVNFDAKNFAIPHVSLLSLREGIEGNNGNMSFSTKYNVSERVPELFLNLKPLDLVPTEESRISHLFKVSNTSVALDCYEKLPQYSIIIGLLKEYSYFLSVYYRLKCEHNHEYHDGSKCGDTLYMIDLLENRAEVLSEKKTDKRKRCFNIEVNIVSVQSRYYNETGFIGRLNKEIPEPEFLLIERSFLRRVISQYEQTLINKSIAYETYCISKVEYKGDGTIDCYRLRLESWILEQELIYLSEEHFKRISRFGRLENVKY
ncbi:hypothetical protein HWI79_3418 [Cryptosporidium felis]|nr:hypothetical protein HWI79_3418 [Cryptosporidium felis]